MTRLLHLAPATGHGSHIPDRAVPGHHRKICGRFNPHDKADKGFISNSVNNRGLGDIRSHKRRQAG